MKWNELSVCFLLLVMDHFLHSHDAFFSVLFSYLPRSSSSWQGDGSHVVACGFAQPQLSSCVLFFASFGPSRGVRVSALLFFLFCFSFQRALSTVETGLIRGDMENVRGVYCGGGRVGGEREICIE